MKAIIYSLFIFLHITTLSMAQPPQEMIWQGVIRDSNGNPLANQSISVRFTMHKNFPTGVTIFSETHTTTTNQIGLAIVIIGSVNPLQFSTINWGAYPVYQETEIDTAGGTNFVTMGTEQIRSVAYALVADSAIDSRHSSSADTATYAITTGTAIFAFGAGNANYASNSGHANESDSSEHSLKTDSATHSIKADTAKYALNGSRAGAAFLVYRSAIMSTDVIAGALPQVLDWNTEVFDDGDNFSAGIYTASDSGYYQINVTFHWRNDNIVSCPSPPCLLEIISELKLNNSLINRRYTALEEGFNNFGENPYHDFNMTLWMVPGDEVWVEVSSQIPSGYFSPNGDMRIVGGTFSGHRIY